MEISQILIDERKVNRGPSIDNKEKALALSGSSLTTMTDSIIPKTVYKELETCLSKKNKAQLLDGTDDEPTAPVNVTEQSLALRLNIQYKAAYLDLENRMYKLSGKRLSVLEDSCQIFLQYTEGEVHCLICPSKIPNTTQSICDHVFNINHQSNLRKLKADSARYDLLKQFITSTGMKFLTCRCCNKTFENSSEDIKSHIKKKSHKNGYHRISSKNKKTLISVLTDLKNSWCHIRRFCCVVCIKSFNYKIEFMKHVVQKHMNTVEESTHAFDFCIMCVTLWFAEVDCYEAHSNDIMHKYLAKTKTFEIDKFPKPAVDLLNCVNETVDRLFELTERVLSDESLREEVRLCLKDSLKSSFPDIRVHFFGSRITGLAFPDSDMDIYIEIAPDDKASINSDVTKDNDTPQILSRIQKALVQRKEDWVIMRVVQNAQVPIIKLKYKRANIDCDISVTNRLSLEKSKLLKSFNDAYPPCRKMIIFLKKWLSVCKLNGRHGISNNALAWYVIFFLQVRKPIKLPSVSYLIMEKNQSQIIEGWETGVASPQCNTTSDISIRELLLQFFRYYEKFNFKDYVACPLTGKTVRKGNFIEPNKLPKAMWPYIKCIESSAPEYFRIDSHMCIQDPFVLSRNFTKAVSGTTLLRFILYCKESAEVLSKASDTT